MITVQPVLHRPSHVLVTSDRSNPTSARREIAAWAGAVGLQIPPKVQRLTVIDRSGAARLWMVLDRPAEVVSPTPSPLRVSA